MIVVAVLVGILGAGLIGAVGYFAFRKKGNSDAPPADAGDSMQFHNNPTYQTQLSPELGTRGAQSDGSDLEV